MANLKALALRIRSVRSIQKTTRVMQMISASKFRIAREGLVCARDYCSAIAKEDSEHRYLAEAGGASGVLLVVFSSDKGLCGGFNHSVAKFLREYVSSMASSSGGERLSFLFVGKKAHELVGCANVQAFGEVVGVIPQPRGIGFLNFKSMLYSLGVDFSAYSRVVALYSRFYSSARQEPTAEDVLIVDSAKESTEGREASTEEVMCNYDPNSSSVRKKLYINSFIGKLYLAMCESLVCEHCSRMVAMESANSNTKSMLNRLLLDYNRSRQASITTDLIEIVSGCEALG
ncbi:F0F1 ATP synthase subunit gamma [Anaplasma marginale]|nr:FoF1 ATP synthase subunit gamma [Anaplasma marginale]AXW84976.1 F0F1 ATP synthase subunit gamma [Anaplasma marginale]KAA8472491.1 F0F1 ATP synthase subunit gamma [Anaplasma marginale]KAB0450894.1 F0F1 ATP synthase subunit gamma [Anaplasma marginale]TZF78832.1 F0F1 ATP synthase subunit gamma [Anaplasma marginale]